MTYAWRKVLVRPSRRENSGTVVLEVVPAGRLARGAPIEPSA